MWWAWVKVDVASWLMITILLKTPVELPTFLFSGNYRSPSFAFQPQHFS